MTGYWRLPPMQYCSLFNSDLAYEGGGKSARRIQFADSSPRFEDTAEQSYTTEKVEGTCDSYTPVRVTRSDGASLAEPCGQYGL